MKNNEITLTTEYCKELLRKFPTTPILTLAKKAYKDEPKLFLNVEQARTYLRRHSGLLGDKIRKKKKDKSLYREKTFNYNPFKLPEAEIEEYDPFILPKECKSILHFQDIHVPYHSMESLTLGIEYGKNKNVDTLLLGFDFIDFYQLSRFQKDPRKKDVKGEIEMANELLDVFQREFPNAKIFWRNGNHDERLEKYLAVKAPELLNMSEFKIETLLRFKERGITHISNKRIVKAGKLNIIHGDEFMGGGSGGANPARALFLKTNENTLCGHFHKTSEHIEKTLSDDVIGCWSIGCATQLHPEYARNNKWNNGFAHILVYDDGHFHINNMKVIKGKLV